MKRNAADGLFTKPSNLAVRAWGSLSKLKNEEATPPCSALGIRWGGRRASGERPGRLNPRSACEASPPDFATRYLQNLRAFASFCSFERDPHAWCLCLFQKASQRYLKFCIPLPLWRFDEDHGSLCLVPRPPMAAKAPRLVFSTVYLRGSSAPSRCSPRIRSGPGVSPIDKPWKDGAFPPVTR